jgi:hypothetical protein
MEDIGKYSENMNFGFRKNNQDQAKPYERKIRRRYRVENHVFRTTNDFAKYGEAIENFRPEIRGKMHSAKMWHHRDKIEHVQYGDEVKYSGTIVLGTLLSEPQQGLEYFDQRIKEIFGEFRMQYRLVESS